MIGAQNMQQAALQQMAYDSMQKASAAAQGYQNPAYEPPPPPSSILASAISMAERHGEFLTEIQGRLQNLRDRVFGAEPTGGSTGQSTPQAVGAAYILGSAFERNSALIKMIDAVVSDLERIA